jgi:hypothetical protein
MDISQILFLMVMLFEIFTLQSQNSVIYFELPLNHETLSSKLHFYGIRGIANGFEATYQIDRNIQR